MRVGMAPVRHAWLRRVWMSLPKNKEGHATVDTLQQHYRPDRHPDVVLRKRTEDEVINEFISTFNEETNPRGTVSPQEFEQYYTGVSTAYFDDEQFVALLRGVWEIPGVDEGFSMTLTLGQGSVAAKTFHSGQTLAEKKEVTNLRRNQTELLRTIVDKHRPPVIATTASIRRLTSAVRQADLSETTFVSVEAFLEALRQSRLYFDDVENILPLDTNGDRTVDILYYLELLLPQLPPTRLMLVERMWATVFPTKDSKDRVDVLEFQRRFKAKDGEEKSDFLNAWDVRTAVNGKVRLAEVMEWYIPQSAKVVLDKDFEALIARQWPGFKVSD
ncbi:hypothetical protein AGDE_07862 [Angomonas deanei]|nr:hypothetical protein AGDE_07862 [Angomonas deanei]|eukprot:EPY34542.1 hypothetical protein AGDE_07862 [Angomonas deanei]